MVYWYPVISVLLSFAFVWLVKPKKQNWLNLLLAFSGAFLLAITFFELLPEIYSENHPKQLSVWILAGILLQIFLEFFSKGAEHGHMHYQLTANRFPTILFISLSIHALIEGVPMQQGDMLTGILVHKVPISMLLSLFLINSNLKKGIAILFIVLFALMTPLGSFLATETHWVDSYGKPLNALSIGIFFHVSTVILFESGKGHSFNLSKLVVIVLGIGSAYFL